MARSDEKVKWQTPTQYVNRLEKLAPNHWRFSWAAMHASSRAHAGDAREPRSRRPLHLISWILGGVVALNLLLYGSWRQYSPWSAAPSTRFQQSAVSRHRAFASAGGDASHVVEDEGDLGMTKLFQFDSVVSFHSRRQYGHVSPPAVFPESRRVRGLTAASCFFCSCRPTG